MIDVFPFEKRYKYPHMKPNDVTIWERFIDKNKEAYKTVQYDFNIGDPPPFNPFIGGTEDLNQDALYRLKIDVVGHTNSYIHIIEVKPKAGPSAIGQVQSYLEIYTRDYKTTQPVRAVILTDSIQPNMQYLCEKAGVLLIVA